jgi:hypothetical protein
MFGKNIFLIISLLSVLKAGEYLISFQYITKNDILIYKKFTCSKAMVQQKFNKKKFLFSLPLKGKSIIKNCYLQQDKIIQYLLKKKIYVSGNYHYSLSKELYITKITFLPHIFDIIIKNKRMYFYEKGEK